MIDSIHPSPDFSHRATLSRRDLMVFEKKLKASISLLVSFDGHSMLFPKGTKARQATWNQEEKTLLLPIHDHEGKALGIFIARNADPTAAKNIAEHWNSLGTIVTDNLLLYKRSLSDPVTGLYSRHSLLQSITQDITRIKDPFGQDDKGNRANTANTLFAKGAEMLGRASFGVIVIRLSGMRDIVREYGYEFADQLFVTLGDALLELCPEQSTAARTGDVEFAVHLPAASLKSCRTLANTLADSLHNIGAYNPLRKEKVYIPTSVGYAVFPQDMQGNQFLRPLPEQSQIMLRKARLATALADEKRLSHTGLPGGAIMAFHDILQEGAKIIDSLPLSRVIVNVGSAMHAKEGQRFSVWSTQYNGSGRQGDPFSPLYKGEVVLMEVQENASSAEIINQGDPTWPMEPGDRLILIPEEQGLRANSTLQSHDPATGLWRYGDFMAKWSEEREKNPSFCLSLLRILPTPTDQSEEVLSPPSAPGGVEQYMRDMASLCLEELGQNCLYGRYGLTSIIVYHPDTSAQETIKYYTQLATLVEKRLPVQLAVGIAPFPYLEFRKADTLENCQKALEYATLLPHPHIGALDSLALNISADKLYSQGDTFGAIKEYQLALIADEGNSMAWNSLGICLAGLGKHAEAERHFKKSLEQAPTDSMTLYNLGYMHQSQQNEQEAKECYTACLAHNPGHLFAMVRLGQLAESSGDYSQARQYYEQAAALPGGNNLTFRHFARLSLAEGNEPKAREYLHEALLHDPQDALAMQLLAKLYLDGGEDPDMAASLARQSVAIRPTLKSGWLELARALDALGEKKQAKEARLKAGEL